MDIKATAKVVKSAAEVHAEAIKTLGSPEGLMGVVMLVCHEDAGIEGPQMGIPVRGMVMMNVPSAEIGAHFVEIIADQVLPNLTGEGQGGSDVAALIAALSGRG